eukprot:scaffold21164_cov54-Attheya_sp.AAC.3
MGNVEGHCKQDVVRCTFNLAVIVMDHFVAPEGWLDHLRQDVRVEFHLEETQNPRASPVALVRCSRGGKTHVPYMNLLGHSVRRTENTPTQSFISASTGSLRYRIGKIVSLWKLFCEEFYSQLSETRTPGVSGDTMNAEFATFLKENFLEPAGRALVFSSHVISVNNTLTEYMHSPNEREVKTKKLRLLYKVLPEPRVCFATLH